ncbi:hypothetical protein DVH05_016921 [Phytophthora capsici]|nr:hypothetical protein DVH05_016921 [Phytophthora capsici]
MWLWIIGKVRHGLLEWGKVEPHPTQLGRDCFRGWTGTWGSGSINSNDIKKESMPEWQRGLVAKSAASVEADGTDSWVNLEVQRRHPGMVIRVRHADIVQMLVNAGANVNAVNINGNTPLTSIKQQTTSAVRSGGEFREIVRILIEAGANVNAHDMESQTSLLKATEDN